MKAPLSWLKEFVPLDKTPHEIAHTLTLLGIEVEGIEGGTPTFSGVVVGKVLSAVQHPNADRLKVATVTDGSQEYQVVCGAPNCRQGIFVAFAKCGAELADDDGKKWKIKKSKLRDVESEGMLCSAKELKCGEEQGGILELSDHLPLGQDLSSHFLDPVFDLALTPNLGHCLSILGIARELAAAYKTKAKKPTFSLKTAGHLQMNVEIADPLLCPRYACRIVTGVKVAPSPEWLQKRLLACKIRPINNLVDIGNFVMHGLGNPLHIFDADKIKGGMLIAPALETQYIETLDGQKRELPPRTLLIRDKEKILAIAGIMGGSSSAVSETTCNIVIEAAYFDSASIRHSSRRLDLKTDASYRFDRGTDGGSTLFALDYAAFLIQEICGGVVHPLVDKVAHPFVPRTISCRLPRLQKLLGIHLSLGEAVDLFERLELSTKVSEQTLEVTIPTYRNDLHQEVDLVEEAARLFGYNHIPRKRPSYTGSDLPHHPLYLLEKEVRTLLLELGLQECITCNLISPELSKLTREEGLEEIAVLHPRSVDQSVLRASLLPGLAQVAKLNLNRQAENILVCEIGRVHFRGKDKLEEVSTAGILLAGTSRPPHFDRKPAPIDFFDLKGMVENLCTELGLPRFQFKPSHLHTLHPWRQTNIVCGQSTLGVLGEIHPHLLAKLDIHSPLFFAELSLTDILSLKKKQTTYTPVPLFPASMRDWNVTLKKNVPIETIFDTISHIKSPFLEDFYLYDIYTTTPESPEHKATLRFIYRHPTKTLDDATIQQEHQKLTEAVEKKLATSI
jgi:phenylalanyl-tRNA synthetase beta chain